MSLKDRTLLYKASLGDQKSIRELWDLWSPKITIFINHHSAISIIDREDLHQEIMAKILLSIDRYNPLYAPSTWIYTLAKSILLEWKRKDRRGLKLVGESQLDDLATGESFFAQFPGDQSTPEQIAVQNEDISHVRDFILSQKNEDRQILFLTCYEGLSGRAAAKILGIPASTVRDRIKKLKNKLQEEFL